MFLTIHFYDIKMHPSLLNKENLNYRRCERNVTRKRLYKRTLEASQTKCYEINIRNHNIEREK